MTPFLAEFLWLVTEFEDKKDKQGCSMFSDMYSLSVSVSLIFSTIKVEVERTNKSLSIFLVPGSYTLHRITECREKIFSACGKLMIDGQSVYCIGLIAAGTNNISDTGWVHCTPGTLVQPL